MEDDDRMIDFIL